MKKEVLKVLYYVREEYTMRRHVEVMSYHEYMDLCLDEDVIIKRKWHVA